MENDTEWDARGWCCCGSPTFPGCGHRWKAGAGPVECPLCGHRYVVRTAGRPGGDPVAGAGGAIARGLRGLLGTRRR